MSILLFLSPLAHIVFLLHFYQHLIRTYWVTMQLSLSDLNLVYACTRDKTLMIDVQAREISEKDLEAGLRLAHPEVSLQTCNYYYVTSLF